MDGDAVIAFVPGVGIVGSEGDDVDRNASVSQGAGDLPGVGADPASEERGVLLADERHTDRPIWVAGSAGGSFVSLACLFALWCPHGGGIDGVGGVSVKGSAKRPINGRPTTGRGLTEPPERGVFDDEL